MGRHAIKIRRGTFILKPALVAGSCLFLEYLTNPLAGYAQLTGYVYLFHTLLVQGLNLLLCLCFLLIAVETEHVSIVSYGRAVSTDNCCYLDVR